MKNTSKMFGIIAIVAIIGFSMAACGDMEDNDFTTEGQLTINGLGSYNGWLVYASLDTTDLEIQEVSFTNDNNRKPEGTINNGSVTIYVWKLVGKNREGGGYAKSYNGNDQNVKFGLTLNSPDLNQVVSGTATANFTNGKASGQFVKDPD